MKNISFFLLSLILVIFHSSDINIQSKDTLNLPSNINQIGYCATDHLNQKNRQLKALESKIEKRLYSDFKNERNRKLFTAPPYVLPVVVHIIHQNGAENITDAQVLQGVTNLNEAYANINYYNQNTGVNTQIQFCLAKQDPEGNSSTGINRIESHLTNLTLETEDLNLKNLIRWNPLQYINIWLVEEICSAAVGCGVAAYAYYSSAR